MAIKNDPLVAGPGDDGKRLDRVIRRALPALPLSGLYRLIRSGHILINGRRARNDTRIRTGDRILVDAPIITTPRPKHDVAHPDAARRLKKIELFCNTDILALNKPYGVLVHGNDSLDHRVKTVHGEAAAASLSFMPGPAHRLDRNTTGIILFSLSVTGARLITAQFREHRVKKIYCALVDGHVSEASVWRDRLTRDRTHRKTIAASDKADGPALDAETVVVPLFSDRKATLVLLVPHTGRTHQLRAQAALHGHSLSGDAKYGGSSASRYLLHHTALSVENGELGLPALLAPFDQYADHEILSRFGKDAVGEVYRRARSLLPEGGAVFPPPLP